MQARAMGDEQPLALTFVCFVLLRSCLLMETGGCVGQQDLLYLRQI